LDFVIWSLDFLLDMAYACELCLKKTRAGRQHTHHTGVAGGQWKKRAQTTLRSFKPNLHMVTLPIKGKLTRVKACAKCIKRVKFDMAREAASKQPAA
jgi:ribosomal protein L28